jgi:molybdopterin converting factor small subunit
MEIKVQFFSQLRELTGVSEGRVNLPESATVADLLVHLYRNYPELRRWDTQILIGAGVEFVDREYRLQPEDSIAIMPPVQGG